MLLDEIKVKLEIIEENIYEFEDTEIQIIKYETQRKWRKLKSIKNLWNKFMWPNMYVPRPPESQKSRLKQLIIRTIESQSLSDAHSWAVLQIL